MPVAATAIEAALRNLISVELLYHVNSHAYALSHTM